MQGQDDPLQGARWKVHRAMKHHATFTAELNEWLSAHTYAVEHTATRESTEHTFTIRCDPPPPFDQWALTLGECVHALRSALDHVVYQLGYLVDNVDPAAHEPPNARDLAFPICVKRRAFKDAAKRCLPAFPSDVITAIESLQPYHMHDGPRWLTILSKLDNDDKHRVLVPMATPSDLMEGSFRNVEGRVTFLDIRWLPSGASTDEVATVLVTTSKPSPDLVMLFGRSLSVGLADFPPAKVGGLDAAAVLDQIGQEVTRCMLALRGFLEAEPPQGPGG